MGYKWDTTPTLDRMAKDGLVFENAIAPGPRTPESMPAVFTGEFVPEKLPSEMVPQRQLINRHMSARTTLPERFSEAGYETTGFTPNPFASRYFGFDGGFDYFQDFIGDGSDNLYQRLFRGWLGGDTASNVLRLSRNMLLREEVFKPWEAFYEDVIDRAQQASKPYFLWIFLMDVHEPYIAGRGYHSLSWFKRWQAIWKLYLGDKGSPFDGRTRDRLLTTYDDSIRYTDAFFDRLLASLGESDPVIAVHGDHGEAFGEHGVYSHEPYLYEENVHVPLVFHGVEQDTIKQPMSLRSLPDLLTSITIDGQFDDVTNPFTEARTAREDTIGLRTTDHKYIQHSGGDDLYTLCSNEREQVTGESARELYRQVATNRRERIEEKRLLSAAAEETAAAESPTRRMQ